MRRTSIVTLDLDSGLYTLPVTTDADERGAYLACDIGRCVTNGARVTLDEIAGYEGCSEEHLETLVREQLAAPTPVTADDDAAALASLDALIAERQAADVAHQVARDRLHGLRTVVARGMVAL